MEESAECSCRKTIPDGSDALLEVFARIRDECPALKQILVPDTLWPKFQKWNARPADEARHWSVLLLALKRGHLERITSPIHKYLLASGLPLRTQYSQDLREQWMGYACPLKRHWKGKGFLGKLVELQCAEWLEGLGWEIVGLEALRAGPDIEARRQRGQLTAFEVKFIGIEDVDFEVIQMSLKGKSEATAVSTYTGNNYLVFRAYQVAKQLQKVEHPRIVLLVVDEATEFRFIYEWIDWNNPRFFEGNQDWQAFLRRERPKYPGLDGDLRKTLLSVDAAWIVKLSSGYKYDLIQEASPSPATARAQSYGRATFDWR